jgi:hypothetical protein
MNIPDQTAGAATVYRTTYLKKTVKQGLYEALQSWFLVRRT